MSRRCLVCANTNPCAEHSEGAQMDELRRNDQEIARIRSAPQADRLAGGVDFEDVLSRAQLKMRAFQRRPRGQLITNQDSLEWWVFHETIEATRALAEGAGK